jgi:hypothetical protein
MERWKRIKEYPKYLISNEGRIKSFWHKKPRILKLGWEPNGYAHICLYKDDGTSKFHRVSCLVAQIFIPNPDNLPEVNHKNGIKSNNKTDNLEWCTSSYNIKHSYDIRLRAGVNVKGSINGRAKLTEEDVPIIRDMLVNNIPQACIAERFGITQPQISLIKLNKRWTHVIEERCY